MRKYALFLAITLFVPFLAFATDVKITGCVVDAASLRPLQGASIYFTDRSAWHISGEDGSFTLAVTPAGQTNVLVVSYMGYVPQRYKVSMARDTSLGVIKMVQDNTLLPEASVYAQRNDFGVQNSQMSAIEVPVADIKGMPSLFGEVDVMKALQRLPGVQSVKDGNAGIYVRGGNYDQNLIMLDGSTLYNSEHLNGFVSSLNADMIDNVIFYKGAFPARYGSRLSGIIDVGMKEGDYMQYGGSFTIGLLASKFQVEGPIFKGKTSFNIGARFSYFDLIVYPMLEKIYDRDKALKPYSDMDYYDINAKVVHKFSKNDKLSAVFYMGQDVIKAEPSASSDNYTLDSDSYINERSDGSDKKWGNIVSSLFWTHRVNERFYVNTNLSYSRYKYRLKLNSEVNKQIYRCSQADSQEYSSPVDDSQDDCVPVLTDRYTESSHALYHSQIDELALAFDFRYTTGSGHDVRWGARLSGNEFDPTVDIYKHSIIGYTEKDGYKERVEHKEGVLGETESMKSMALYVEDDWTISENWKVNAGLRYMHAFVKGKNYPSVEPRVSVRWLFAENMAFKASYSRMAQSIHLLSSNNLVMPSDIWVPVTDEIPIMKADQWAFGFNWEPLDGIDVSLEGYYKKMDNVLDYKEGTSYMTTAGGWKEMVAVGKGRSYGAEIFVQKKEGTTTGWLSYTWSKSLRRYDRPGQEISGGEEFYAGNDCRNNFNIVVVHKLGKRLELSLAWTYQSGRRGIISSTALYGGWLDEYDHYGNIGSGTIQFTGDDRSPRPDGAPYFRRFSQFLTFRERNNYQLPDTHRLDFSLNWRIPHDFGESVLNFTIYNLYNRQNVSSVYIGYDNRATVLKGICLFPFMPSLSYTFKF